MATIKPRNDPVRLFWKRILTFVLVIGVLFGLWAVVGVYIKERESSNLRVQSESQLKDLQIRQAALKQRIASLETERGQEAALREAYQVGKEGEGVVTIVDEPASNTPARNQDDVP